MLTKKTFENIMVKGANADNQHFLLSSQCFLHFPKEFTIFCVMIIFWSANALNLDYTEVLSFFKGLTLSKKTVWKPVRIENTCITNICLTLYYTTPVCNDLENILKTW